MTSEQRTLASVRSTPLRLVGSLAVLPPCLLFLCSCQTTSAGRALEEAGRYDTTSVHQLVPREPLEALDLALILDPEGKAAPVSEESSKDEAKRDRERIDHAFAAFYTYDKGNALALRARRNRVQERILAASTQRCNSFKQHLQRAFSRSNLAFGAASTSAGVAGAVVKGEYAARVLAGVSGLFGGLRAEVNQNLFANLTVNVIVSGIEERQRALYSQVTTEGQAKSIDLYPVEAAVKDALFIHGQCSVISGLQVAADSIKLSRDPGIEDATAIMMRVINAQKIASGQPADEKLSERIESIRVPNALVGTALKQEAVQENAVAALNSLVALRELVAAEITEEAVSSTSELQAVSKALTDAKCVDRAAVLHRAGCWRAT